jgi:hypothetical protein
LKALTRGDASLFGSRGVTSSQIALASLVVNRAVKADRISPAVPSAAGPTIVFTMAGLDNRSVATLLPAPPKAPLASAPRSGPQAIGKTAACEPPVSALAEAARLLETGRCVT